MSRLTLHYSPTLLCDKSQNFLRTQRISRWLDFVTEQFYCVSNSVLSFWFLLFIIDIAGPKKYCSKVAKWLSTIIPLTFFRIRRIFQMIVLINLLPFFNDKCPFRAGISHSQEFDDGVEAVVTPKVDGFPWFVACAFFSSKRGDE